MCLSRLVGVRPRTRAASSASVSKVSSKSPMRNRSNIPGCWLLASLYCRIIGVSRRFRAHDRRTLALHGLLHPVRADLRHADRSASIVVRDLGHVVPHQEQAPAAGPFQVLRRGRVWHVVGIKAGAFIDDLDLEPIRVDAVRNADRLGPVQLVAVFDGVDQGLFEREADAEDFLVGEFSRPQRRCSISA